MGSGSQRRKKDLEELDLNLNPMMDMFSVLIPTLLVLSAAFEIAVVGVATPAIGPSDTPPPESTEPPLNFMVTITEEGYKVTARGMQVGGDPNDPSKPSVPLVEKTIGCSRYRGTVPPPRRKNLEVGLCPEMAGVADKRKFMVYNTEMLTQIAIQLKDANPTEKMVNIAAEPTTDFEPMVEVMDAVREIPQPGGEARILFNEVVVSPAAM